MFNLVNVCFLNKIKVKLTVFILMLLLLAAVSTSTLEVETAAQGFFAVESKLMLEIKNKQNFVLLQKLNFKMKKRKRILQKYHS